MDAAERKRLIAKDKENKKIAEAVLEEKRILASKPVHRMQPDPRLKNMKKSDAVELLKKKREAMAAGAAVMAGAEAPKKEAPKVEEAEEAPKKERRSKKVK